MSEKLLYRKGETIISEGSDQRNAYIIEKGRVIVSQQDEKGKKTVIAIRGHQEIIGEMTLLEGGTRSATVTALEDCELSVLSFERFQSLPDSNPGVKALRKIMNERKLNEDEP